MTEKINVCCPQFYILECEDTDEHCHIGCNAKSGLDDNPIINNDIARRYCISAEFDKCPYYPKNG